MVSRCIYIWPIDPSHPWQRVVLAEFRCKEVPGIRTISTPRSNRVPSQANALTNRYHSDSRLTTVSGNAKMPRGSSTTGLIAARVRPVYKPEPKKIELVGSTKPAPFTLRPFAGLFNPFPYGCSVLCNHPADGEAKEFVRRAKESWATEGKALLLPGEMEMIRATLVAGVGPDGTGITEAANGKPEVGASTTVPEELFRKYTETDSRPLTPAPTLASGPLTDHRHGHDDSPATCNPRERTTLVLDLRTNSQEQDNETLSWHALTLERQPSPRKGEVSKPSVHHHQQPRSLAPPPPPSPTPQPPVIQLSDAGSSRNDDDDDDDDEKSESETELPMRRRGKRLRKRKCRRGSAYGQQTEVRDPPEPPETQVSQVNDASRRNSTLPSGGNAGEPKSPPPEKHAIQFEVQRAMPASFINPEILKHLGRELDRETIEEEFSIRRRMALEEAYRIKGEFHSSLRGPRQAGSLQIPLQNVPRVFSRQNSRFQVLDSASLADMKPLDYLSRHVFLTPGRKLIFGRSFNRYYEETLEGVRYIQPSDVERALEEILGKSLTEDDKNRLDETLGEIAEPLSFRTWCGLCAFVERLIAPLPPKEVDPPAWIEQADFQALERRLRSVNAHPKLIRLLREIRHQ